MPSLSSISTSLQGVLTQSQVLEIIQQNVANAGTPGYRRQSAILTTSPVAYAGNGYVSSAGQRGGGVTVARIDRFNLDFFDGRYRAVSAETQNWEAQTSLLNQLEVTLSETSDDGLLPKLDQFWAGWEAVSSDPTNTSLRGVLLSDAAGLATAFNRRTAQINQLRSDQNLTVSTMVDQINSYASDISTLNGQISHVLSVGEQPNDLLDKRDLLLDKLSDLTGSVSFEQKNGEMVVSVGGQILVVGQDVVKLQTQTNASGMVEVHAGNNQLLDVPSGELKGILEVRDHVLVDQLSGLNTLAGNLITKVNQLHSGGYGLDNSTGLSFFSGSSAADISVDSGMTAAKIAASGGLDLLGNTQEGNSAVALAIANLKSFKLNGSTFNEYYNTRITDLAVTTKTAIDNSYQYGLVSKALGDQRESVAGVSLDEEAANMAKAQKAYQASARMLTAMDELLDLVINRMGLAGR